MSDEPTSRMHVELPATGPGSPAGWPRRIGALLIDWGIGNAAAVVIAGPSVWLPSQGGATWLPLVCWIVLVWLATALTGASAGQWLLGLRVIRLDRRPVGLVRAGIRSALVALVVPPLIFTPQGRGLHDLAADTIVVKGPNSRQ